MSEDLAVQGLNGGILALRDREKELTFSLTCHTKSPPPPSHYGNLFHKMSKLTREELLAKAPPPPQNPADKANRAQTQQVTMGKRIKHKAVE